MQQSWDIASSGVASPFMFSENDITKIAKKDRRNPSVLFYVTKYRKESDFGK